MSQGPVSHLGRAVSVTEPPRGRRGNRRSGVRRARLVVGVVVAGLAVVIGLVVERTSSPAPPSPAPLTACTVASTATDGSYSITPAQAQNAAIIAAVALRQGMPDHAVTVALATSLQESQLQNLPYGDQDSLGLFQQRPSQGWGTSTQIMDPNYAASAFYDHLAQVSGWQTMPVTEAAQLVQHSATPDAYATWEAEARSLARALTGEVPAGFSCHLDGFSGSAPPPTALFQAATTEMGSQLIGAPVSTKTGWQVASWAVAHADNYHLSTVSFAGWRWTVVSGTWASISGSGSGTAQNTVAVT